MEDMAATASYGYDGKSGDSVESNPNHYESVEKRPRLDVYEIGYSNTYSDDDEEKEDVVVYPLSDCEFDSSDCEYGPGGIKLSVEERKRIKKEKNKKFEEWEATIKSEDIEAPMDTAGACILEMDSHKLKLINRSLLHCLACLLSSCRRRMTIYTFTQPDEDGLDLDGGGTEVYESSELSDIELQSYSTKARKVIQQYNDTVTKKNSDSGLEFVSFIRSAYIFPSKLFITFTARQNGNGQLGTYQAALSDDFFFEEVQLVFLRHVEADKILAILSLSGAEEELKEMYGEHWND